MAGTLAIVGTAPFGAVPRTTIEAAVEVRVEAEATDDDGSINTPLPDAPGEKMSDLIEKLLQDPPSGIRITQSPPKHPGHRVTAIVGTPDPGEDRSTFDAIQQLIDEASP